MVIDDEPLFLKTAARHFSRKGYEVLAQDCAQAAARCLESQGDSLVLIIVDYDMPAMNGIEFAQLARASRPDVPIVMLSGYPPETFTEHQHHAVDAILYKPVDLTEVEALIT
jgi:CheY-like chemotaxis protein